MKDLEWKSVKDFFNDDKTLEQEVSYEEYCNGVILPENSDHKLEDVYDEYVKLKELIEYSARIPLLKKLSRG